MRARLLEARPAHRNEARQARMLPAGIVVTVTGTDSAGRFTADYCGWGLNFTEDQAEPVEE